MSVKLRGGDHDGEVGEFTVHDDADGRWIEFVYPGEVYVSRGEKDSDGVEIFEYVPGRKGPMGTYD